jgi:hypothetical protein
VLAAAAQGVAHSDEPANELRVATHQLLDFVLLPAQLRRVYLARVCHAAAGLGLLLLGWCWCEPLGDDADP